MFLDERREKIIEKLNNKGKVFVKDLALEFKISEGMIRKDLQNLEKEGKLKRTYGGAIKIKQDLVHLSTLEERITDKNFEKEKIASKIFENINNGDTVFLDISSINYILAEKLSKSHKEVVIITNMPSIIPLFSEKSKSSIIGIGGLYNKKIGGIVGSEAVNSILQYRVDKAFVGSCGVNPKNHSVSNFDLEDGNTKKAIISIAKETYIISELKKFKVEGVFQFCSLEQADYILTEEEPSKDILKDLKDSRIKIIF